MLSEPLAPDACHRDLVTVLGAGGTSAGAFLPCAVERPARLLSGAEGVRFPVMLKSGMIGGSGRIQFIVDTAGRVVGSSVLAVEASHELFRVALRNAMPALRFEPARRRGRKVPMVAQLATAWVIGPPVSECPHPQRIVHQSVPHQASLVVAFVTYEGCMIDFQLYPLGH